MMKVLAVLLVMGIGAVAEGQTTTNVTVSLPKEAVWVDLTGAGVTPLTPVVGSGLYASSGYYFDVATGLIWRLFNPTTDPFAAPFNHADGMGAWWYTSANCSGPAYLVTDFWVVANEMVEVVTSTGVIYAAHTPTAASVSATFNSKSLGGSCSSVTLTVPGPFLGFAPADVVTTSSLPIVPAGPYHLEYR